jgi:MtN3 and saliva related transmembrane protein
MDLKFAPMLATESGELQIRHTSRVGVGSVHSLCWMAGMEMNGVSLVGYIAAFLTTVAYLPQVVRAWRTRSTHDVSLLMFLLMSLGVFMWLAYGLLIRDVPMIAANAATLVLAGSILYLKIRYR